MGQAQQTYGGVKLFVWDHNLPQKAVKRKKNFEEKRKADVQQKSNRNSTNPTRESKIDRRTNLNKLILSS